MNNLAFRIQSSVRRCFAGFSRQASFDFRPISFLHTSLTRPPLLSSTLPPIHNPNRRFYHEEETSDLTHAEEVDRFFKIFSSIHEDSSIGRINSFAYQNGLLTGHLPKLFPLEIKHIWAEIVGRNIITPITNDIQPLLLLERNILESDNPIDIEVFDYQVMKRSKNEYHFDTCDKWLSHLLESGRRISIFTYIEYMDAWSKSKNLKEKEEQIIKIFNQIIRDQAQILDPHIVVTINEVMSRTRIAESVVQELFLKAKDNMMKTARRTINKDLIGLAFQFKNKSLIKELLFHATSYEHGHHMGIFKLLLYQISEGSTLIDVNESLKFLSHVGRQFTMTYAMEILELINTG
ncbi:hypothetical protein FSP39_007924 [Pinctada imbricata]|uniref:Uncharacterized protein n=1 Tax=Pinctada imbricata TaxID=66713 RepID=A0AA89C4Y0_PINIB|nr:hypothetical protein FSP39_007924 [Pinctada imbricata]